MLEKLQKKFVVLIMACVSLVLAAACSAICLLTYNQDLAGVNALMQDRLEHAISAKAHFQSELDMAESEKAPGEMGNPGKADDPGSSAIPADPTEPSNPNVPADPTEPNDPDIPADPALAPSEDSPQPPFIGGGEFTRTQLTPVVVYEINAQGLVSSPSSLSTALISDEYLDEAIEGALAANENFGHLSKSELLYGKRVEGNTTYIAFADEASVGGWKTLAVTLAGVGLVVLGGFWLIGIRFSCWALAPVERAWAQQRQFVADASHELKTPLTVILANSAILQAHPEASVESQRQWIDSTQTEATHMQQLVNDMLELAQLDGEKRNPEKRAPIDLSDAVESEMLQFESVAFERGVVIEESIASEAFVRGDAERIRRLVRTLLDNACKYSDEGSTVTISLEKVSAQARLNVSSKGAVIAEADLDRIFDRFYRADEARTRETGGYGLGLAIACDIARDHDGDIFASCTEEGVTTFTLILPLSGS